MKNIFSKTTENRTQNGVKSYSFPTRLLSPILIFTFLTLGFGQMRGATTVNGGYIYFDEYNSGYTGAGDMQFWIGHNSYSCAYSMSKISNTKLWYCQASSWGDATYFAFTSGANWGCAAQKYYDRIGSNTWKSAIKESYTLNSGSYYVFKVASTANKAAVNSASPYGNQGNAVTSLNKTITVKAKVSTDGGGNYKEETSPGTLSASSYKFTDYNSCASATSLSSGTISCGYTATTTLTAADATGYNFVGWYNSTGTQQTTSKTITIYPTEDATYYAYYKANTYTVTYNANDEQYPGTASGATTSSSHTYGTAKNLTSNGFARAGYIFAGWATTPTGDVEYTNGQSVTNLSPTQGATVTLYAKWTKITLSATISPSTISANTATSIRFTITTNAPLSSNYYFQISNWGDKNSGTAGGYNIDGDHPITLASPFTHDLADGKTNLAAGTYKIKLKITKDAVLQVESELITLVVSSSTYSVTVNAGAGGIVSPKSISASPDSWSGDITATPNAGYRFDNWTSSGGGITINNSSSATTQIKANSTGGTLTANFTANTYRVSLDNQSATTAGTEYVDATYNTTTLTSITKPTKNNYTFGGYYTETGGNGTQIIDADGNWLANKEGFTDSNRKSIITENKTLYAHWTEIKYEVTISVSNPSATTGTIDCSAAGWVASNHGTAQIGNATSVRIIVGAAASGYTWGSWVLSGGVELISGNLTDAEIVVKATSAGTATYTYAEDISTTWYISGDGDGTGKDLTPGSPFSGWGTNGTRMYKKAGYSTVEKYYCTITVSTVATTDEHFPFKVYTSSGEKYYGNNGYWVTKENNHPTLSSESGNNMKFRPYITGEYEFEVDNTGANPVLTVHWPSINQLRVSVASPEDGSNIGNFDLTETSTNNWSVTRTLNANTTYTFKMVFDGAWYGNGTAFTRDNNSAEVLGDGNYMTIQTDVAGEYTFTFNSNSKNLSITYPTAYRVTYGVGTGYTSMGRVSTEPSISSGDYVIEGTEITFTATPNLGYKFVGWYNDAECTGAAVSTDASYTIASLSANTTLYAKFDYRPLYIHADFAPNGWDTPVQMTQSTENRAVYTYEIDPLAAKSGAPASEGHHFHFVNTIENPNDHKAYNYKGVQTPTGSGFLTNENIHLTDEKNATIQFDLMRKSKITITLTLQSIDDDPKPTVNIAADPYYDITYTAPSHGTYTIQVGNAAAVSTNTDARATTTITLANTPATGYHLDSWKVAKNEGNVEVSNNQFTMPAENVTVSATFTANTYSVQFNGNGATDGSMANQDFTYDAAQNLTANAFTKTGYTFAGWATEATGAVAYTDGQLVYKLTDVNNGTATLYAKWTPNQYTVTLDKQTSAEGYGGDEGTVANQTVTFDATPATVTGIRLTAKNGWAFMGFYSATGGNGRRFIDPFGEWVANAGDTIRDSKWVYDGNVTLYAYYKKAEITDLIFDAAVVAPGAEVGVTPKVDPTPAGTNSICWKLLYNNGNLYTPQPEFDNPREIANKVTFTAPNTSGMYLVAAVLRTGTDCNGGTKLDSVTAPFQVAGDHTVTVQYKCGNTTIKASTSATGKPLEWTAITAPEIVGYSFSKWKAGDGITIDGADGNGEKADATINFKAIYDGQLTAIYSKKNMIYFNNTLGWSDVWVYFYTSNKYWDNNYGTGAWRGQYFDGSRPYYDMHRGQMTQIEGTNIWYFDYTAKGWDGWQNVAFTNMGDKSGQGVNPDDAAPDNDRAYFSNTTSSPIQVIRRGDHKTSLPMFVPLTGVDPVKMNNKKAEYYNEGYWMNYPENTGYTLHIYSGTTKEVQDEIRSIAFPFTADKTMPMEVTLELNANTTYGYEIHRADNTYYAKNGTIKINASSDIKLSDTQRGGIKTSAAGDYVFKLNFGNSSGYGYLFSVQYPVAVGSYRIVYTESGETLWSGHSKPAGWHHPSRSIEKKDGAKDIVSFYVKQGAASMKFQYASAVDGEGNVTWTDVAGAGGTIDLSSITQSGVYNFHLTQTNGSISVDKVEPYTGNYYIRTDNAGSTKWDNYRAADHQMTYSEFSKDRATNTFGELYTHYYMHWCPRGTNVKFCIANDYSSCITDTLENDLVDLHNMVKAGWLNSDGANPDYRDKFSANIRFMYDERTNKISRAYMSSSTNTDRKFLVLKSNTEFWNSDGSALSGSGESAVAGNYEAIFKDNEDWIYEREIKLTPGQKFKLYASYAQETAQENGSQHFCGNYEGDDWLDPENYVALVGGSGAPCNVRIIYDFKTNRLLAAMVPSGEISTEMDIYADVMFIREHQGDIEQLIFNSNGKITNIKTAYGVMRFNKWTLNNKDKDTHNPLASPASIYERAMYFISFPFEVKLSEVFGFGTYGQDWIIEYYDGAERARTGWWEGQPGFWRYVWDRKNFVLKPNVGYLLELELGNFKEGSGFWNNNNERLELFFPSSGNLGSITNASVTQTLPAHTCTIDKTKDQFGNRTGLLDSPDPSKSYNRTVFDSHWNIMSVPTYVNVDDPSFANTTWIGGSEGNVGPKFLYTWNMNDNTLTATSGKGFMYHAMHAYTVQYYGNVTWTTSVTPTAAPQRNTEYRGEYEFCLEVKQDEQMIDRTFVRLSDDENVTTGFEFSEDMTKQFNSRKANIFTIAGNTSLGGNSLPLSTTQTTVVPVGVKIKTAGDYTFSIPEGTDGIGVTLVDNETGVRTLLSALDYTVNLAAGDYTERFWLEISPIQNTPTGIEEPTSDSSLKGRAQKRIIDGVLYIVKDGKIFDARGTRVE